MTDGREEYPEHEKQKKILTESQAIGEFIDSGGYTLCTYREAGDNGEPPYRWIEGLEKDREPTQDDYVFGSRVEHNPLHESWGGGYVPVFKPIQQILAEYFEIDLDKIEAEKRMMLETLRAAQG